MSDRPVSGTAVVAQLESRAACASCHTHSTASHSKPLNRIAKQAPLVPLVAARCPLTAGPPAC